MVKGGLNRKRLRILAIALYNNIFITEIFSYVLKGRAWTEGV
jgi:hypothetical protein